MSSNTQPSKDVILPSDLNKGCRGISEFNLLKKIFEGFQYPTLHKLLFHLQNQTKAAISHLPFHLPHLTVICPDKDSEDQRCFNDHTYLRSSKDAQIWAFKLICDLKTDQGSRGQRGGGITASS